MKFSTCAIKVSVQKVPSSEALRSLDFQMKVTCSWFLSQQIAEVPGSSANKTKTISRHYILLKQNKEHLRQ